MSQEDQTAFDLSEAFNLIEDLTKLSPNVSAGMTHLLDYCEYKNPHTVWASVRTLDFEGDTKNLESWLEHVLSSEPPSHEIIGFWFGLFNRVEEKKISCALYISGSTKYLDESDWAVWNEASYLPNSRYADSKILHEIFRILEENNMLGDAEYILCLGYACFAVHAICNSIHAKMLLGERGSRTIAVGFDSGDYIILSEG